MTATYTKVKLQLRKFSTIRYISCCVLHLKSIQVIRYIGDKIPAHAMCINIMFGLMSLVHSCQSL